MGESKKRVGPVFTQIALAIYFTVTGLCMLGMNGLGKSTQVSQAVYSLFAGNTAQLINIVLGILILVSGALLIIRFFWESGSLGRLLMVCTLIVWIVVTVIIDVFSSRYGILNGEVAMFTWLLDIGKNLLIIGGLMTVHS